MRNGAVPFKIKQQNKLFTKSNSTVQVLEDDDKVIIEITKQFPSPGYNMDVDKIVQSSNGRYDIHVDIVKPDVSRTCLQVITYKTISVEIDKRDLDAAVSKFNVEFNG